MKKAKADSEEKGMLDSFERGEWRSVANLDRERRKLRDAARATLKKDARINIRLASKDLKEVQVLAAREGIPYQTLVSSIIHKYVSGSLVERT